MPDIYRNRKRVCTGNKADESNSAWSTEEKLGEFFFVFVIIYLKAGEWAGAVFIVDICVQIIWKI